MIRFVDLAETSGGQTIFYDMLDSLPKSKRHNNLRTTYVYMYEASLQRQRTALAIE